MTRRRQLLHLTFLILLPIAVAWFGISTAGAIALVLGGLLWRWAITFSGLVAPEKVPTLELETIAASHFVEKVRWCMDRLQLDYSERQVGGVLGAVFTGRSVPSLKIRTGITRSVIGNSPDILRYLWGAHAAIDRGRAGFLEPTPERLDLERKFDRYGVDLQVWVYYHILDDRDLTLHAWGVNNPVIPVWQRYALRLLFPLLRGFVRRTFQISRAHHAKAVEHIEKTLADAEQKLAGGSQSFLDGNALSYIDITFAALSGLWLQPAAYGGGRAESVRIERDRMPVEMRAEIERWIERFPAATDFVYGLYESER